MIGCIDGYSDDWTSGESYRMLFKDGCDGAGQHVVMNSKKMFGSKKNMFLYGLVHLKLDVMKNWEIVVLWENRSPNSELALRPVYLIREIDTETEIETVRTCYQNYRQSEGEVEKRGNRLCSERTISAY